LILRFFAALHLEEIDPRWDLKETYSSRDKEAPHFAVATAQNK
jgi:hypothetical protein